MMVTTTNGFTPSPSGKSVSDIINQEPRSPPTKRICDDLNSAASTPKQRHADSDSHRLQLPTSPTRSLKRLFKSASKNALKLASTLSSRRHHSSFDSSSPKSSSTDESGGESREGMVKELRAVFRHLDADGDGKISWVELKSALNSVEEEAGENELREMIKELDSDGDGCIDMDGFIRLNSDERGAEEAEKELMAAYRMFEGRQLGGGITPMGKTLRISSNKQNLQVLQQLRVFERKRSRIPKPTTRYRWKKEKREEAPSYDEVYEHPPKLYDTKEDFSVGAPVLLVDGYNVCGYWPKLKKHFSEGRLRIARQKLADELICFSELRGIKVVVVYDAMRSGLPTHKETYGNIDIVYSANSSADTWIEKEVTALRADGCPRVCVATSDSLQQHSAHHLGAFVWSCKTLISEINDTKSDYKELQFEQRSYSMQDGMLENNLKPEVVDALKELKKKLEEYERSQTRSKRLQETGVQA